MVFRIFLEPSEGAYSYILKFKADCAEEKQTLLSGTFYGRQMGKGGIISEHTANKIMYPKPGTGRYKVMKFACLY